jgi:hypothetical protein
MFKDLICPVSEEKIDSYVSQLTIFISVILVTIYIFTLQPIYLYIATLDYGIRAFSDGALSPLRYMAIGVRNIVKWETKMINKAPKIFASRLGFLCLLAASILINLQMPVASVVIAVMATSLFLLDALGVVCVGCLIYYYIVFPMVRK